MAVAYKDLAVTTYSWQKFNFVNPTFCGLKAYFCQELLKGDHQQVSFLSQGLPGTRGPHGRTGRPGFMASNNSTSCVTITIHVASHKKKQFLKALTLSSPLPSSLLIETTYHGVVMSKCPYVVGIDRPAWYQTASRSNN